MVTERFTVIFEERGTRRVTQGIDRVGDRSAAADRQVRFLRRSLALLGGALVLRQALRTLSQFEQEMATVRAVSGATEIQFNQLRDAARDLGATTRFSATQAAEGLVFLARAGFEANEQLASIEDTLLLAQAGNLGLARAADIASNVLRGFRLEADQAGLAVDVLAFAANNSNTNVEQLGDALKFVAPIAAGVGVSMQEATAAISALSDAGLQASLAGTGLRRVISELESPSSTTNRVLAELGLTAQDVRVSQVGLTQSLINLKEAGIDTGQALELFGDRGGPAFEVLSNSIPQVIRMTEALGSDGLEGTARRVAETMDDNLNGALFAVRSALEAVIIALGDLGNTTVLTTSIRGLAGALRFLANNAEIVQGALFGLAFATVPLLITQLGRLKLALAGSGFGLILIAAGAATGAIIAFSKQSQIAEDGAATLGDVFNESFNVINAGLSDLILSFANVLPAVGLVQSEFRSVGQVFVSVIRGILTLIDFWIGTWQAVAAAIVSAFKNIPFAITQIFVSAFNAAIGVAQGAIDDLVVLLNILPGVELDFSETLGKLTNPFEAAGGNVGDAFIDTLRNRLDTGAVSLFDEVVAASQATGLARESARQLAKAQAAGAGGGGPGEAPALPPLTPPLEDLSAAANTLKLVSEAVDAVRASEIDLGVAQMELNRLIGDGVITTEQAAVAFRALEDAALQQATSVEAGVTRGFRAIQDQIMDFASLTETAIVGAFNSAEDALVNFVQTGELNFSSFVDSVLADLTRLLARQALVGLIGAFAGDGNFAPALGGGATGGGGFDLLGGGAFSGFAADGARGQTGQSFIAGEDGRELVAFDRPGRIFSNPDTEDMFGGSGGSQAPPTVNIINAIEPSQIAAAMNSPEGGEVIFNAIELNPRRLQNITSR